MYNNNVNSKQEQMYVDIVQLVADIAKEGFGIDVIHNPLFSGVFKQQLERHHQKLVGFIYKYVPVEIPPPVQLPSEQRSQQEHTSNPVSVENSVPWPVATSKQSEQ